MSYFSRKRAAILAGVAALSFYLGYLQYGFDEPLTLSKDSLTVVVSVSQLLKKDSDDNE